VHRNEQIRRIEKLNLEVSTRLAKVSVSSRRPMATIMRHRDWLFPSAGFVVGITLAKVPFRRIVTRGISATILAMRIRRIASRALQKM